MAKRIKTHQKYWISKMKMLKWTAIASTVEVMRPLLYETKHWLVGGVYGTPNVPLNRLTMPNV